MTRQQRRAVWLAMEVRRQGYDHRVARWLLRVTGLYRHLVEALEKT